MQLFRDRIGSACDDGPSGDCKWQLLSQCGQSMLLPDLINSSSGSEIENGQFGNSLSIRSLVPSLESLSYRLRRLIFFHKFMKKKYVTKLISETPGLISDVISLDNAMRNALSASDDVKELKERLENMKQIQSNSIDPNNDAWKNATVKVENEIQTLTHNCTLRMYLVESAEIVDKYKNILKQPLKMSFMGPVKISSNEKKKLQEEYLKIYEKYNKFVPSLSEVVKTKIAFEDQFTPICTTLGCISTDFKTINETIVCEKCSCVQVSTVSTTSYADIDRINVSTRYLYDRKVHFRDCILQFQGRQNVTIDKSVYDGLEIEFGRHHLLVGDENTPVHIRFSKITQEHISMFLKELRLSKHYENVQLIHFNLTGIQPPDISRLEGLLLSDFEQLTMLYDEVYRCEARKNFINTQYTLFQLLKRHKYPCNVSDFSIIKTSERRDWHHRVCKNLFSKLNWNFTAV